MTSGTKTPRAERRRWLALPLLLAGLGCAPAGAQGAAFDLAALMRRMAGRRGGEARFTEERQVGGLDGPLHSSGTLSFAAPDRFARHTLQPVRESMEVQGRTLHLRRGGRSRQMQMDSVPELAALLDAMRATLTGDEALLTRHFNTTLSGTEARWVLQLVPRDDRLARQVQQIELAGLSADVRSIELRLAGGDRSLMLIEPLVESAAAGAPAPR
ncbi:LolA-related protein [Pseudorhodoferax sp.]|uniref:LolA-related protein n=1 Tax=Pseudorhodoferax sp. TaxID=1993553 RepID=UPI002DD62EFB|nr:LolA-related protein [Pseudorhodoferax sp.]